MLTAHQQVIVDAAAIGSAAMQLTPAQHSPQHQAQQARLKQLLAVGELTAAEPCMWWSR